jgi:hypothetical protein
MTLVEDRLRWIAALAALALAALVPAPARADALVASPTTCAPDSAISQPFAPWLDFASYMRFPDGGFESGAAGWTLDGARLSTGNEPFAVADDGGARSLALAAGTSAASPTLCVGVEHPTFRLFARSTGAATGTLVATITYRTSLGATVTSPAGSLLGATYAAWRPTEPMLASLAIPVLPGERTPVTVRFTAGGLGSSWVIDDVYLDPYRH